MDKKGAPSFTRTALARAEGVGVKTRRFYELKRVRRDGNK